VVDGTIRVDKGQKSIILSKGESVTIESGTPHGMLPMGEASALIMFRPPISNTDKPFTGLLDEIFE
jgi:mannose-6-phosphate isomerase-like protein (cupin superfamily)